MRTIFITGATGTLGSKILEYHVRRGDNVIALSRCDHKIKKFHKIYDNKVSWVLGDIRLPDSSFPKYADTVYHCAASQYVDMR